MHMKEIFLNFFNTGVNVETDSVFFLRYIKQSLRYNICDIKNFEAVINSKVYFHKKIKKTEKIRKYGDGVYLLNNGRILFTKDPNYSLSIFVDDKKETIQIELYVKRGIRNLIKNVITYKHRFLSQRKYYYFQAIARNAIHFPLFWYLENYREIHLLHGAAIKGKENICFIGLDGAGKTRSVFDYLGKGYKLISDNFILFDESKIYAFFEALRLDKTAYIKCNKLVPLEHTGITMGDRGQYLIPREFCADEMIPDIFVVPLLSFKNEGIKKNISQHQFMEYALGIDDYVKENHRYTIWGIVSVIMMLDKSAYIKRYRCLEKLTQNKIFEVKGMAYLC